MVTFSLAGHTPAFPSLQSVGNGLASETIVIILLLFIIIIETLQYIETQSLRREKKDKRTIEGATVIYGRPD